MQRSAVYADELRYDAVMLRFIVILIEPFINYKSEVGIFRSGSSSGSSVEGRGRRIRNGPRIPLRQKATAGQVTRMGTDEAPLAPIKN